MAWAFRGSFFGETGCVTLALAYREASMALSSHGIDCPVCAPELYRPECPEGVALYREYMTALALLTAARAATQRDDQR